MIARALAFEPNSATPHDHKSGNRKRANRARLKCEPYMSQPKRDANHRTPHY